MHPSSVINALSFSLSTNLSSFEEFIRYLKKLFTTIYAIEFLRSHFVTVGLEAFRKFLQTEFSDENIEFWLACEDYKDLKPSKMVARAHKIYEDYVTIQAPREVRLIR